MSEWHIPCEPACGADRFCTPPKVEEVGIEAWTAFWAKHPSRAKIRPLRIEAAIRSGGRND